MKHGGYLTRLYGIWEGMRSRCLVNIPKHSAYAGKGINVCKEWDDFSSFREWALSNGYTDALTIDRVDFNGDYSPENCRWVTQKEQCNNTSRNIFLTHAGRTQTISQWAEELGIKRNTMLSRLKKGLTDDRLFAPKIVSTPKNNSNYYATRDRLRHLWRALVFKTTSVKSPFYAEFKSIEEILYEEWKVYEVFRVWAYGAGYCVGKVLSRRDRRLGFVPSNCQWLSKKEHARSKAPKLVYKGEELTVAEWAIKLGLSKAGFVTRINSGLSGDNLFKPRISKTSEA